MDFSGGVKHWDKCKLRTALEWVVFISSRTAREGMGAEEKRKKTRIIPGTQPKARAGWSKRLTPVAGLNLLR